MKLFSLFLFLLLASSCAPAFERYEGRITECTETDSDSDASLFIDRTGEEVEATFGYPFGEGQEISSRIDDLVETSDRLTGTFKLQVASVDLDVSKVDADLAGDLTITVPSVDENGQESGTRTEVCQLSLEAKK